MTAGRSTTAVQQDDRAEDDDRLAARLASQAGVLLLGLRNQMIDASPDELMRTGDGRSHELLVAELTVARPQDAVLSEEDTKDPRRQNAERVWIVDPVDGTREFAEPGRDDWAVHVALWERGVLVAGAVALPAQGVTLATRHPPVLPPPPAGQTHVLVSRTRPPRWSGALAEALDARVSPMGSAGAKAMAVVQGKAHAYVHAGGQYEWDSAAPVAVAAAAGLHTSRVDGSALIYNRADPLLPDLVVCRLELRDRLLDVLKPLLAQAG